MLKSYERGSPTSHRDNGRPRIRLACQRGANTAM
ncbi:Uncharacterised protein [Vibrio cholerae]|nr:Uncharacterised protein [Vibrio cholerae]